MTNAGTRRVPGHNTQVVWLSGEILTVLNKMVFPFLWAIFIGIAILFLVRLPHPMAALRKAPIAWLAMGAFTGFVLWLTMRVQRVGYDEEGLVLSDYFHRVRVGFDDVAGADPVWWYWNRMVRVRFRRETLFGYSIYYLPKWGGLRALWARPHREFEDLVRSRTGSDPDYGQLD